MRELERQDFVLIEMAKKAVRASYDGKHTTVGAAVRCGSGNVYTGVNFASVPGVCAEAIAVGTAKTSGETRFECIVAVGGRQSDKIHTPCGSCREFLLLYCPDIQVVVHTGREGAKKLAIRELLPFTNEGEDGL